MTDRFVHPEVLMRRLDDRPVEQQPDEIIAVLVCRNESLRLPFILEYYRRMGVGRFFVVDNESDDGSVEYLQSQPDVHIYSTPDSYRASRCGLDWSQSVLNAYGHDRWCLIVDADEMLVFPGCECTGIRELADYLESHDYEALFTFMLDMYSQVPVLDLEYRPGQPFLECCRYFDGDSHYVVPAQRFPFIEVRGGARERAFFRPGETETLPPPLKKIPFIHWRRGLNYASSTHILERPVTLADVTGILLHFKFFQDAPEATRVEVERGQRWQEGAQYRRYNQAFTDDRFTLYYPGSVQYRDSLQMVEMGFMRLPSEYRAWLGGRALGPEVGEWLAAARTVTQARRREYSTQYSEALKIWPGIARSARS